MSISEIKSNEKYEGHAILRHAEVKTAKSGKSYLDAVLTDKSGEILAKSWNWDSKKSPPAQGAVVKFSGKGNEFNEKIQIVLDSIEEVADTSQFNMHDLVPHTQEDPRAMFKEVLSIAISIKNKSLRDIVCELLREANHEDRLLSFPAARKLHHAVIGGFLHHITTMLRLANAICDVYPHLNRDLLFAGVIVHDLGKFEEMSQDETTGLINDYTTEGKLLGHILLGAEKVAAAAEKVGASKEASTALRHLIISHHGCAEYGSIKSPSFPEAEVLSKIDELDARIYEMEEALKTVEPGEFSAKVWALDNREIYKMPDLEELEPETYDNEENP